MVGVRAFSEGMGSLEKFVFVSYKSEDRALVKPYLDLLDGIGVKYWWDQFIDNDWSTEIDKKLTECSAVIGFLTEKSVASAPVYEECRTASTQKKFIPVKLDQAPMQYSFRALISLLNYIDLSSPIPQKNEAEKLRLIRKIEKFVGFSSAVNGVEEKLAELPAFDFSRWVSTSERLPHIAYLISLCFFEGQHHDRIQMYAALLEDKLTELGLDKIFRLNSTLTIKQAKLQLIEAEIVKRRCKRLSHEMDFIKFENHLMGEELLFYIWDELDQLKAPIFLWVEDLIERMPESINDLATGISKIGRRNFFAVYSIFLRRWLQSRSRRKFLCADITISLMASDPDVREYIREQLFDMSDPGGYEVDLKSSVASDATEEFSAPEAKDDESQDWGQAYISNEIAVDLVTGFTGMAMPDLSIHVFKKLEDLFLDPESTVQELQGYSHRIRRGIRLFLIRSKTDSYAKSMLRVFAGGIKQWATDDVEKRKSLLPEYIFNLLLDGLTVGRSRDLSTISLSELLSDNGKISSAMTNAFAMVVATALESGNSFIRDEYKKLFKTWVANLKKENCSKKASKSIDRSIEEDRQAFMALFRSVLEHASTENDKDRVRHIVKEIFDL